MRGMKLFVAFIIFALVASCGREVKRQSLAFGP